MPFIKSRGFECGQACTAMMIRYFNPDFDPDFDKFNQIIHHKKGMSTFPQQNAILLDHYGVKCMSFSSDNISTTKEDPDQFKRWFGKEWKYQMKFIDIPSFNWMVGEFRRSNLFKQKVTQFEELLKLLKKEYLVCIPINWSVLSGEKSRYQGHFVILTGMNRDKMSIHDPDVGPFIEYPVEKIKKAWDSPPIEDDYFVAYGKK